MFESPNESVALVKRGRGQPRKNPPTPPPIQPIPGDPTTKWAPALRSPKGLARPRVHKTGVKKRRDAYAVANSRGNARTDKPLRTYESKVTRQEILDACLIAQDEDPRMRQLVVLMLQKRHARTTFAHLTALVKISLGEYLDITRAAYKKLAVTVNAHHLVKVVEDIALDSYSTRKPCWKCDGTGRWVIPAFPDMPANDPIPCIVCGGVGVVREPGDKDSRQTFLELEGLVAKKGGSDIHNTQVMVTGSAGSFESIIARRDRAMDLTPDREDS